jgi:hypothetical protein
MKNSVIILAGQRTGSTGLGRGLAQLLDFDWLGEIFHSDFADPTTDLDLVSNINKRANFFNFRYRSCINNPTLTYPSKENQKQLFQEYMDFVMDRFNKQGVIIDIKYTSLHHLNTYWRWPNSMPFLLELIRGMEIPVLHVVRENLFAQYCSYKLALKSDYWHRSPGEGQPAETLTIDVKDAESFMNVMQPWRTRCQSWLTGPRPWLIDPMPNYILNYEEVFEDDFLSKQVIQIFSDMFSYNTKRQAPVPTRKVTPNLSKVIENIDEVLEHFKETQYDGMVRKSLTM